AHSPTSREDQFIAGSRLARADAESTGLEGPAPVATGPAALAGAQVGDIAAHWHIGVYLDRLVKGIARLYQGLIFVPLAIVVVVQIEFPALLPVLCDGGEVGALVGHNRMLAGQLHRGLQCFGGRLNPRLAQ